MIYRLFLLFAAVGITAAYVWAPGAKNFPHPETAKIIFFHVPPALLCTAFFFWGAVMAGFYLKTRNIEYDIKSLAAIEIGTILVVLATLTGMVFAKMQWGRFWEWDPRQTTILIQFLIYAAYFALRSAFTDRSAAAKNSAAYAIVAFLTVPFLIFVVPRLVFTLHGEANKAVIGGGLDLTYRIIFYTSFVVIFLCCALAYKLRVAEGQQAYQLEDSDGLETRVGDSPDSGVVRPVRIRGDD